MLRKRVKSLLALALAAALFTGCVSTRTPTTNPGPTPTPGTTSPGTSGTEEPVTGVKKVTTQAALAVYENPWRYQQVVGEEPGVPTSVANAIRKFSETSFNHLLENGEENVLFVPLSLYMDLAMLTEATAGQTRQDLDEALNQGFPVTNEERQQAMKFLMLSLNKQITEGDMQSRLSNALWLRDGLSYKEAYAKILQEVYQADSYTFAPGSVDKARKVMGEWIEEKTNGLLDESALPDDFPRPTTLLALLNALYYRSSWSVPFDEALNTEGQFQPSTGEAIAATFMNQTFAKSRALVREDYQVADILMSDLSRMRFLLPDEGVSGQSLPSTSTFYTDFLALDAPDTAIVHWSVPKSDVDGKMDLFPLLENLGLSDLSKSMDMSAGLDGSDDAFLSAATQAVRIKMNEKGVEAAAVTVLGVDESAPMDPLEISMTLDRPFYAALFSPEGQVIFMAYIENPQG